MKSSSEMGNSMLWWIGFTLVISKTQGVLYPFGTSAGDTAAFPLQDDHCYGPHQCSINLFGKTFHGVYVCTNGILSLGIAYNKYSSLPIPLDTIDRASLIAPFWADADLTIGGKLWRRETTDPELLEGASHQIKRAYRSAARDSYKPTWMLIATWEDVVPFVHSGSTLPQGNTFQAVLVSDGTTNFAIFNYRSINWISGYGGASPAQVGFDAGDGQNCYIIPNSRTPNVINITSDSNVGVPGRWMFQLETFEEATNSFLVTSDKTTNHNTKSEAATQPDSEPITERTTSMTSAATINKFRSVIKSLKTTSGHSHKKKDIITYYIHFRRKHLQFN